MKQKNTFIKHSTQYTQKRYNVSHFYYKEISNWSEFNTLFHVENASCITRMTCVESKKQRNTLYSSEFFLKRTVFGTQFRIFLFCFQLCTLNTRASLLIIILFVLLFRHTLVAAIVGLVVLTPIIHSG